MDERTAPNPTRGTTPPIPLAAFRFWHPWRVRYRDCDQQGVVYFSVYLEYTEQAIMEYFRHIGVALSETIRDGSFDWTVVHADIDYLKPARFDDLFHIGVRVLRCGRSSFDVEFVIADPDREAIHAFGRLVLVCFDSRTGQACPIPQLVREQIRKFEAASW